MDIIKGDNKDISDDLNNMNLFPNDTLQFVWASHGLIR